MQTQATLGNLACLRAMHALGAPIGDPNLLHAAILDGYVTLVDYLLEHGRFTEAALRDAFAVACRRGWVPIMIQLTNHAGRSLCTPHLDTSEAGPRLAATMQYLTRMEAK